MKKSFKPNNMLFPMPVLIISTYNEDGSVDCMNAAWGTLEDNDLILLELTSDHLTSKNILRNKSFTVAFGDKDNIEACDYVGIVSGNNTKDKFSNTQWHAIKSEKVNAPIIDELPITLECELERISTDNDAFVVYGRIKGVIVEENILNEKNQVDLNKASLVTYNSIDHTYRLVGESVAKAFSCGLKLKK